MVCEMNMPWDKYFTGYIQLHHTDPRIWLDQVNMGNEDYFNQLYEFQEFIGGVTYAGNLHIDGEWWVGFDTELDETRKNVVMFLQEELGVAPEDIDLFTKLKTVLSEDEDEDNE